MLTMAGLTVWAPGQAVAAGIGYEPLTSADFYTLKV